MRAIYQFDMDGRECCEDGGRVIEPVTEQSTARAIAARDAERAEVTRQTGVRFQGDTMVPPTKVHQVQCGICWYKASAVREGQAINSVAAHIVRVHLKKKES